MKRITRRHFIKKTAIGGAALTLPAFIPASVLGRNGHVPPSDRVTIGMISCGDRSGAALDYRDLPNAQVLAVCDPIEERRMIRKNDFGGCDDYNDFRELLARTDIDAVHIATADHWHVPISLAAARAGKDMYTEKPLGISIEEDLAARQITDTYGRIFQYGTQNRSLVQVRMGTELVLNGHIGDIKEIYVWCPQGESGGSATPILPVPQGYDYDLWQGPAPARPFCQDRCLTQGGRNGIFHIYDYAIGFIAGWGAHPLDQLQWWADKSGMGIPVTYEGSGTIPPEGLFNTVTHWNIIATYQNGLKMHFVDNQTARAEKIVPHIDEMPGFFHGTMYVGTEGWITVTRSGWKVFPEALYKKGKAPGDIRLIESTNQRQNFVDAVQGRHEPISNLNGAIGSDLISHLSDICIRTGRKITWDADKNAIVGDGEARKMMSRPMRAPWKL